MASIQWHDRLSSELRLYEALLSMMAITLLLITLGHPPITFAWLIRLPPPPFTEDPA